MAKKRQGEDEDHERDEMPSSKMKMQVSLTLRRLYILRQLSRGKYFRLFANIHCGIVSDFDRSGEKF